MRRIDRWLTGVATGLVLGGMATASLGHAPDEGVRERLLAFVAAVDAREAAIDWRRGAGWGETCEGEAFVHYAVAAREHRALAGQFTWHELDEEPRLDGKAVTAERLAAIRAAWAPVVAAIERGARCVDRKPRAPAGLLDLRLLWGVRAEASARLAEGAELAAARLWLDLLTAVLDHDEIAESTCRSWVRSLMAFWNDARLARLGGETLDELQEGLARLDRRLDVADDPELTIAEFVRPWLDGTAAARGWTARERIGALRCGFDPTRQHLAGLDELIVAAAALVPPAATCDVREAQWRRFRALPRECGTWLTSRIEERIVDEERCRGDALAELRLLRLGAAFHRRLPLPRLRDPHADAPLRAETDGLAARFASAGGRVRLAVRGS